MPSPRTRLGYCTTTAGVWRGTMARRCVGSAWPRTTVTPAPRTISVGCTLMEKAFRAIWPKRVRRRLVMAMNCQKMACRKLGDRTTGSPAPRPWRPATRRRKHRLRRRGQGSLTARPNARGRAPSRVRVGRDRMNEGPAVFVRCLEGSAECGARAAKRLRDLVFEMEIAAPDQRHVGFDPAEGVGFVHKAGGQNARHGSSPQLQRRQLRVPEAINDMVIDHPSRLHKSVANRRPYALEAAPFQILAHRIRFFGGAWNVAHALPCILHRCVIDEPPNIGVEAGKMPLHLDKSFGIHDGGFDLQSVAYDPGIGEQFSELPLSVSRDLAWLEIVKGAAVALALSQYGNPAQPCLRAFENEQLEQS